MLEQLKKGLEAGARIIELLEAIAGHLDRIEKNTRETYDATTATREIVDEFRRHWDGRSRHVTVSSCPGQHR